MMRPRFGPTLPRRGDGWIIAGGLSFITAVLYALGQVLP